MDAVPDLALDEGRVKTGVEVTAMGDLPDIDRVVQQGIEVAATEGTSALAIGLPLSGKTETIYGSVSV